MRISASSSDVPKGWEGTWKDAMGERDGRGARVFWSSGAWTCVLSRGEEVVARSRHDSRANALRKGRTWLRTGKVPAPT